MGMGDRKGDRGVGGGGGGIKGMSITPFLSLLDMKIFIGLMLIFISRIFLLFLLTGLQTNSNNFSSITFGNN